MTKLVTSVGAWPWDPMRCPADEQFIAWLNKGDYDYEGVLHMGTGGHHMVGMTLADYEKSCLGLTDSQEEYMAYMDWAQRHAEESRFYKCWFTDVHMLDDMLLPQFEVITLFHLGESPDPRREEYGADTVEETITKLLGHLTPGGKMLFYTKSTNWKDIKELVTKMSEEDFVSQDTYEDLLVLKG